MSRTGIHRVRGAMSRTRPAKVSLLPILRPWSLWKLEIKEIDGVPVTGIPDGSRTEYYSEISACLIVLTNRTISC